MKTNLNIKKITKYCLPLFLFFVLSTLQAQTAQVDAEAAREFAESFFKTNASQFAPGKNQQTPVLQKRYQSSGFKKTPIFVFQQTEAEKGFAIVAQFDDCFGVVGYSPTGNFTIDNMPAQLESLLMLYEDSLSLQTKHYQKTASAQPVATPLLDEAGVSLNQYYHEEAGYCPTGCVATAFAQIMAYYKYPEKGQGSHCYTHPKYGQLCADFGNTTYNWKNPTDNDYRKLSFHIAVAMNMDFCGGTEGSTPSISYYAEVMNKYFKYNINNGLKTSDYLRNEIDNKRPVYITLAGDPGHAVVVDGYDTDGLFHLNFGWGGSYNGYFMLNNNSTFKVGSGNKFDTNIKSAYFITPYTLETNKQDSLALAAIHNAMNETTGWDTTQPVSTWRGVVTLNGRVIILQLDDKVNRMEGEIPDEIGNLTALQELTLVGKFYGQMPSSISNLTELKDLSIMAVKDNFKVILPENIGDLSKLEYLEIPQVIDGKIPTSIGNLRKLKKINLSNGNLTGTIPSELGDLTNLTSLDLWNNKLSGSIPTGITNLTKLIHISLSENQLSGSIPGEIGNLTNLQSLWLNDNQLTGTIPESMGKCINLTGLYLYNNGLSGNIPASLGLLSKLKKIDFKNNKLSSLPEDMSGWTSLKELDVGNNEIETLPDGISALTSLVYLNLNNNKISKIPDGFGFYPSLVSLYMSGNALQEFPDALCNLSGIQDIVLSNNRIKEFPVSLSSIPASLKVLHLNDNELTGLVPKELLESKQFEQLRLANNRFIFEDIPESSELKTGLGAQKQVQLNKQTIKVMMGDTIQLDIRELAPFYLESNQYQWISVVKNTAIDKASNPILHLVINEQTINDRYYCSVTNPDAPKYTYTFLGGQVSDNCIDVLKTDTISFQLANEDEILSEKFNDLYIRSTASIKNKEIEDKVVSLVPPKRARGAITWQGSLDGKNWANLADAATDKDLKANVLSNSEKELKLEPITAAYYRCEIQDKNCEPLYSDTIKVNPYGTLLYEGVLNVTNESKTVKLDSIEVTVPANLHDKDFTMKIVKVNNPPSAGDKFKLSSAYDVTLSFADTFKVPLVIKLKNIDKKAFTTEQIHMYEAAYLDKNSHEWIGFKDSYISLQDTTMVFQTNHLTVVGVILGLDKNQEYDKYYIRNNIIVFYKDDDEPYMRTTYGRKQTAQPWHKAGVPMMVQDVTEYLDEVRKKFKSESLPTPDMFTVFIKQMDNADGIVGVMGMINDYLTIHTLTDGPIQLRSLLAHEYMHYTQAKYITPDPSNIFWMEANAHTTDRLVWDESVIPVSESEKYLLNGRNRYPETIYKFLSTSWDHWDKGFATQNFFGNIEYCYLAGTFIHYLRSYSTAENKLNIVNLLKEHSRLSRDTWLRYLSNYVAFSMNSLIGDEYEEFVKYIISGENMNFTILNTKEHPYSFLIQHSGINNDGPFVTRVNYKLSNDETEAKTDKHSFTVPYLASKVVLLINSTPDKAMVVNYKQLHDFKHAHKVYHGTYNFTKKKMEYVDISDSTSYSIFLESRNVKSVEEQKNISFLLFINKTDASNKTSNTNFDASFELTALPVYDIAHLSYGAVAGRKGSDVYVHTDNSSNRHAFVFEAFSLANMPYMVYNNITEYSSTRSEVTDKYYVIDVVLKNEFRVEDKGSLPSITRRDRNIRIKYNFVDGEFDIMDKIKRSVSFEDTNPDGSPKVYHSTDHYADTRIRVQNIYSMDISKYDNLVTFKTRDTQETQAAIKYMSDQHRHVSYNKDTGKITSDKTINYQSTDFSRSDIVVILDFQTK